MTTTTKTQNPHSWFFAYLKTVDGWGKGYDDTIKESIINDYSGGKTQSLKELLKKYPAKYRKMRNDLSLKDDTLDQARKRLLKSIFANLEARGYKPTMEYVKSLACRSAKVDRFNNIELEKLKSLFNSFKNKNLQINVDDLLNVK